MKKLAILVICLLACFALLTGCTNPKGSDDQASNVNSGVEIDMADEPNSTGEPAVSDTPPDSLAAVFLLQQASLRTKLPSVKMEVNPLQARRRSSYGRRFEHLLR